MAVGALPADYLHPFSKRRMTEQAKADVEESQDAIDDFKNELTQLERRRQEIIAEIQDKWGKVVGDASEVTVVPKKSDISCQSVWRGLDAALYDPNCQRNDRDLRIRCPVKSCRVDASAFVDGSVRFLLRT